MSRDRRSSRVLPRRGRGSRAFTLVEVLAALVLVGVVLPVAMRGVSLALAAADTARHHTEAATLAESKLGEWEATGGWATAGDAGDFGPDAPDYRWTCTRTAADFDTTALNLTVAWTQAGRPRSLTLTTLVADAGTAAASVSASPSGASPSGSGGAAP